jgi:hypothetical protein
MRKNNSTRQAWQAAANTNGKARVLQANQGNVPAAAEPQKGHRRYLHA